MNHSFLKLFFASILFVLSAGACAQQSGNIPDTTTKSLESATCAACAEAWQKTQTVVDRIKSLGLSPNFNDKKTISQQRQVKFEIAKILADFLKKQKPLDRATLEMSLNIWMVGALYDEHYTIAEDNYLHLKPAIKSFYALLKERMITASTDDKNRLQAIADQLRAAQSEYEQGNG